MRVDDRLAEVEAEQKRIQREFRGAAALSLTVLGTGIVFYHIAEHLSWLNSAYFSTVTLTTVGYGDIVPKTNLGKLFTIFYIFVGIGIVGFSANLLVKNAVSKRELRVMKRNKK